MLFLFTFLLFLSLLIKIIPNKILQATEIYKRLLMEHREDVALNVYVAMCYFKLDIYDVSLEILAVYLQSFPDSVIGINLKACNHFRLYNGKAAEQELRVLQEKGINLNAHDLIRHNLVVFSNGDQALQVPSFSFNPIDKHLILSFFYFQLITLSLGVAWLSRCDS